MTSHEERAQDLEDDLVDQLNVLCEDFGCEPGTDRLHWLHRRLSLLGELESDLAKARSERDEALAAADALKRLVTAPITEDDKEWAIQQARLIRTYERAEKVLSTKKASASKEGS